ncbi:hypothetical protein B5S28_g4928 [[Candida] boidinii]|uniref:Unnamed protein product n=1 Tax=Candida boidinii TaxID=5477 RepID=A0ACB5TLI0_CANBO|nr:hypothetical protein B5S28_g4928 [[Candida] boidinii]OWB62135.1 hypothetical protein B5S29_g3054 [[Candida] boidinii]OWB70640.1 hypothetical protein B5S31_g319 [[Candida] boidinii]OWB79041.1 hypothetical protein B5S32_g3250 [[Candida] boidinii]GME90582.1 unnamed protein product [[Candida] boidinii]
MFMIIIVCMLLMVVITALLPLITGLAKYEKNPNYKKDKRQDSNNDQISSNDNNKYSKYIQSTGGYIPPDELNSNSNNNNNNKDSNSESSKSFGTGVYNKLKDIQRDDLPVQLHLNVDGDKNSSSSSSGLRSRKNIKNLDAASSIDPNAYDYDLNDLIEDEIEDDRQERMFKRVNDYTSV